MKITVVKYDPSLDSAPYEESYDVPFKEYITALEAMVYISENYEELAFDYSCRGRMCGRCAVMLDGDPTLACVTALTDSSHRLEPLAGYPVVRDLVVDRHGLHDKLSKLRKRIRAVEITHEDMIAPMNPDQYKRSGSLEWCARCGVCNSSCPVLSVAGGAGEYVGPAGMIAIASRYYDPLDAGDRVTQAVQEGLYSCMMCGKCDEVCSALEIDHLGIWSELRAAAKEMGYEE